MVASPSAAVSGYLLKQNPRKFRLGQFQRWYISVSDGELCWWANAAAAAQGRARMAGCLDLKACTFAVLRAAGDTRFSLQPLGDGPWPAEQRGNPMAFDARGSSHTRNTWVSSLEEHCANHGPLSLTEFIEMPTMDVSWAFSEGKGLLMPRLDEFLGEEVPPMHWKKVYNEEGLKVVQTRQQEPSMDELLARDAGRLYVGDVFARNSVELLRKHAITRVVCCLEKDDYQNIPRQQFNGITYLDFPVAAWDGCEGYRTDAGFARIVAPMLGFVSDSLQAGESVLLHCLAGAHRAGNSGILCLMHLEGLSREESVSRAQERRPCIDVIGNMVKLLYVFERLQAKEDGRVVLSEALAAARERGYQAAVDEVFASAYD